MNSINLSPLYSYIERERKSYIYSPYCWWICIIINLYAYYKLIFIRYCYAYTYICVCSHIPFCACVMWYIIVHMVAVCVYLCPMWMCECMFVCIPPCMCILYTYVYTLSVCLCNIYYIWLYARWAILYALYIYKHDTRTFIL